MAKVSAAGRGIAADRTSDIFRLCDKSAPSHRIDRSTQPAWAMYCLCIDANYRAICCFDSKMFESDIKQGRNTGQSIRPVEVRLPSPSQLQTQSTIAVCLPV